MRKKITKESAELVLDGGVYPLEAIYGACYVFIDRAYLFLSRRGRNIAVVLRPKQESSVAQVEALAGEFANELLNYVLRVKLSQENKKIRQYIVERALFSSVNVENEPAGASLAGLGYSSEEDPLGIAVPWEEKYGQPGKKSDKKD